MTPDKKIVMSNRSNVLTGIVVLAAI
jgi:hypothetical protein